MKYYTTKELSQILCLDVKTIQKLVRTKQLEAFKVSGRYIVSDVTLKDFLEKRKV